MNNSLGTPGSTPSLAAILGTHTIVDLSVLVGTDLPMAWPTHEAYQHRVFNWFEAAEGPDGPLTDALGPYFTATLVIDEHTGTHADAPSHHIPPSASGLLAASAAGDITADRIPLDQGIGPARVIDARALSGTGEPGISPTVGVDLLAVHEENYGPISAGDVVVINTGWDSRLAAGPAGAAWARDPIAGVSPGWPAPDSAFMSALIERGVRAVGIDTPSMGSTHNGGEVHHTGLAAGLIFLEQLTNLAALPPTGATFVFLGMKIAGGSGAPGRAIAFVPA